MGDVWAALYVLGVVWPGLLLLVSTVIAFRLAKRLKVVRPDSRPPWQYVTLHVALGLGLTLPLGPVASLAWLLIPGRLYWTLQSLDSAPVSAPSATRPLTRGRSTQRHWFLATFFTMTGVLLPWGTGLGVKTYLDAQGRPTLPLEGFVDPASLAVEFLLTLGAWASPYLLLASAVVIPWRIGFSADNPSRDSLLPIWLAYSFGVAATIPVFVAVFWEFDSMMLLVPVGLVLLPPMALGYLLGWWLLRRAGLPE